jgi:hypothetical protein
MLGDGAASVRADVSMAKDSVLTRKSQPAKSSTAGHTLLTSTTGLEPAFECGENTVKDRVGDRVIPTPYIPPYNPGSRNANAHSHPTIDRSGALGSQPIVMPRQSYKSVLARRPPADACA